MANTESTKTFFDTWVETQKNLVDNWYKSSEDLSNRTAEQMKKAQDAGTDYMKNWYDTQVNFMRNVNNETADNIENATSGFKANNNASDMWTEWMNNTTRMSREWMSNLQASMGNGAKSPIDITDSSQVWMNYFQSWMNTVSKMYQDMIKNMASNDQMQSFNNMYTASNNYMKMMEFWMPVFKSFQDKSFTPDTLRNMFNPEQYKGMMDNLFNFGTGGSNQYFDNMLKMWREQIAQASTAGKGIMENMRSGMDSMMNMGNQNLVGDMTNRWSQFMNNTMGSSSPIMKMMTPSETRDQILSYNHMVQHLADYRLQQAQLQYMMYINGVKAYETFAELLKNKYDEGKEFNSFMEFFNEWLSVNDKVYLQLFGSDEYSKLQAQLTDSALLLKRDVEQFTEKSIRHLPVVPRSEMDHLYKTIYELKKKVRNLEKQHDLAGDAVTQEEAMATDNGADKKADQKPINKKK